jgi:hypothetical protein
MIGVPAEVILPNRQVLLETEVAVRTTLRKHDSAFEAPEMDWLFAAWQSCNMHVDRLHVLEQEILSAHHARWHVFDDLGLLIFKSELRDRAAGEPLLNALVLILDSPVTS